MTLVAGAHSDKSTTGWAISIYKRNTTWVLTAYTIIIHILLVELLHHKAACSLIVYSLSAFKLSIFAETGKSNVLKGSMNGQLWLPIHAYQNHHLNIPAASGRRHDQFLPFVGVPQSQYTLTNIIKINNRATHQTFRHQ